MFTNNFQPLNRFAPPPTRWRAQIHRLPAAAIRWRHSGGSDKGACCVITRKSREEHVDDAVRPRLRSSSAQSRMRSVRRKFASECSSAVTAIRERSPGSRDHPGLIAAEKDGLEPTWQIETHIIDLFPRRRPTWREQCKRNGLFVTCDQSRRS